MPTNNDHFQVPLLPVSNYEDVPTSPTPARQYVSGVRLQQVIPPPLFQLSCCDIFAIMFQRIFMILAMGEAAVVLCSTSASSVDPYWTTLLVLNSVFVLLYGCYSLLVREPSKGCVDFFALLFILALLFAFMANPMYNIPSDWTWLAVVSLVQPWFPIAQLILNMLVSGVMHRARTAVSGVAPCCT